MLFVLISSSVLILLIIAVRFVFQKKVDPRFLYAIWILVVIKLLMPLPIYLLEKCEIHVNDIQSSWSIMNVVSIVEQENMEKTGMNHGSKPQAIIQSAELEGDVDNRVNDDANIQEEKSVRINSMIDRFVINNVQTILKYGWIFGAVLFCIIQLRSGFRLRKFLLLNREQSKFMGQNIYVIDQLSSPILVRGRGVRSDIYIPREILDDEQLVSHAILHENMHRKHGDIWWGYIRNTLLIIYWFDPLVWLAALLSKRDSEYACDSAVLENMPLNEQRIYGECLIKLAERNNNSYRFCSVTPMQSRGSELKRRIVMIKSRKKMNRIVTIVAFATVGAISLSCFSDAKAKESSIERNIKIEHNREKKVEQNKNKNKIEKPLKEDIQKMRTKVLKGMSEESRNAMTDKIKYYNLAIEHDYLWDNIFEKMEDPNDLHWNLLYETGEVQIGWAFEEGQEYDSKKTNLTEEQYNIKYGQKVFCENEVTADDFIRDISNIKKMVKNDALKQDLEHIVENMEHAKATKKVEYLINIYQILHDMDYYLLRNKDEIEEYLEDTSLVEQYYGVLEIYK